MVVCRPGRCHCQCGVELWSIPFFKWRRRQSQVATKRVPCQANSQFRYLLARESPTSISSSWAAGIGGV